MHLSAFVRARAVGRAIPALLCLGLLAACGSPGSQLTQFGIVGTFADNCARSIEEGGSRAIYDVPATGNPTFTAINQAGTFRSKIVRADRIGPNMLIMYIDNPGGAWNQIEIRRKDDGFVTTRMVTHKPNDPRPVVAIGSDTPSGSVSTDEGLFVQKCSG